MSDNWCMTRNGVQTHPLQVGAEEVNINDIAFSLARICRYTGHVEWYTVAEHCCLVSDAILRDTGSRVKAMQGLLHDAPEYIIGDISRPVKNSLSKDASFEIAWAEDHNESVIATHFGVPWPFDPIVKEYDTRIIQDEQILFEHTWYTGQKRIGVKIRGWERREAEKQYLRRFYFLLDTLPLFT